MKKVLKTTTMTLFPLFSKHRAYIKSGLLLSGLFSMNQILMRNNTVVYAQEKENPTFNKISNPKGSLANVSETSANQNQFTEALKNHNEELRTLIAEKGDSSKEALELQKKIIDIKLINGDYQDAIRLVSESINKLALVFGDQSQQYIHSLSQLATALDGEGRYKEALEKRLDGLKIAEKAHGEVSAICGELLVGIADSYLKLKDNKKALSTTKQAIGVLNRSSGPNSGSMIEALKNLAFCYSVDGNSIEAIKVAFSALESFKSLSQGEDDPNLIPYYQALSTALEQTNPKQSFEMKEKAVEIAEKAYGQEHKITALQYFELGKLLRNFGQLKTAEALIRKGHRTLKKINGMNHPLSASSLKELGILSLQMEQTERAENQLTNAVTAMVEIYPEGNAEIAQTLALLADALHQNASFEEAEQYYKKSIELSEGLFGKDNEEVALRYLDLASHLAIIGEKDKCKKYVSKAHLVFRKKYGLNHYKTKDIKDKIELCYRDKNRF